MGHVYCDGRRRDFVPEKNGKGPPKSGFSICDAVPSLAVLTRYLRVLYDFGYFCFLKRIGEGSKIIAAL